MADFDFVVLFFVAIVMALSFGLPGAFKNYMSNGRKIDVYELLATIAYSIIVGIIAAATGVFDFTKLGDLTVVFTPIWDMYYGVYLGMIYLFRMMAVPIISIFTSKTTFYATKYAKMGLRMMDQETREWLVSDLPEWSRKSVLNCVDAAQSLNPVPFQYAIQAAAFIFLIENGEVTGSKHYWFRAWFGAAVTWKPISGQCLQQIRDTGKFPDYDKLF